MAISWKIGKNIADHAPVFQGNTTTVAAAPKSFDWRDHGAVTAVKDQGSCGSCWAFSATQQIESQWFLAGNDLVEFAPQQLVSCDGNEGCHGGSPIFAYYYVKKAGGLVEEKTFPYKSGNTGNNGVCMPNIEKSIVGGQISGFTYATPSCGDACTHQNEKRLAANLASTAPASISVDAKPWQDYTGGLFPAQGSSCSSDRFDQNHAVQVVGYNMDPSSSLGKPYWIVRNSWGADWGEGGYIYIEMGDNLCGIADEATFVKIKKRWWA